MRNLQELRNFLLDIIPEIKNGKIEVPKAAAICAATNSIINLTRLEVDYFSKKDGKSQSDFIIETVEMTVKSIENKKDPPYEFYTPKDKEEE